MTKAETQKLLKEQGLTARYIGDGETVSGQLPGKGQQVPLSGEIIIYMGEPPEVRTVEVPDFSGMNRQQASDAAGRLGLYILVSGNDSTQPNVIVTAQSDPPGTQVEAGKTIRLEFADTRAAD